MFARDTNSPFNGQASSYFLLCLPDRQASKIVPSYIFKSDGVIFAFWSVSKLLAFVRGTYALRFLPLLVWLRSAHHCSASTCDLHSLPSLRHGAVSSIDSSFRTTHSLPSGLKWLCPLRCRCFSLLVLESPRCVFTLTRNVATPAFILSRSFSIASRKMSALGASTIVDIPPSLTYFFTAVSSAWLSHRYSMGFGSSLCRKATTKAANSGRFELESLRSTFICFQFILVLRSTYRVPIPVPPFWLDVASPKSGGRRYSGKTVWHTRDTLVIHWTKNHVPQCVLYTAYTLSGQTYNINTLIQ